MASIRHFSGPRGDIVSCQEGATSGEFLAGDLLMHDSAGQVVISTSGKHYGIALQDHSGTQATAILVEEITPDTKYLATYHTDATSQALVGDLLDFTYTPGGHTLEESGATTDVYCVGLKDVAGTASGTLIVKFLYLNFTATH